MIFPEPGPRLFGLPPGADFPAELARGVVARLAGQPPEARGRLTVYLNTARMRERVVQAFRALGPGLLPRLRLVSDLGAELPLGGLPAAVPPLRRRLELARLIERLIEADPTLAPRAALHDLADSLAGLMDEMQGEGVTPEVIARLDVSGHAGHWARTQAFLGIVAQVVEAQGAAPDAQGRQALAIAALERAWQVAPPQDPVLVAGSTGSRGTTMRLMALVAGLPQGAILLPGHDPDMPEEVWASLDDPLTAEDHPQYRTRRLTDRLGLPPGSVMPWRAEASPPDPARNRVISLALRPAPVTDRWLAEGAGLADLRAAMAGVTLVEAPAPRVEALAIALILREAAGQGRTAALVTPDRALARRVTAALDRWGLRPDDSAGRPLSMVAAGRLLRQIARLAGRPIPAEGLIALLNHPLAFSGAGRGPHLLLTRALELRLREAGPAFPTAADLAEFAATRRLAETGAWSAAVAGVLDGLAEAGVAPLARHEAALRARAEALARGLAPAGSGALWDREGGQAARAALDLLAAEAGAGGPMGCADFALFLDRLLAEREVRESVTVHAGLRLCGTREARERGEDLVILGGLTEGVWPQAARPDPWLNRTLRREAGLLVPERQTGLSAHDFQQAVAAPQVILTRALKDAEAETVPSRWLNRLMNLLAGLGHADGPAALEEMRARGRRWLDLARAAEAVAPVPPAPRPSPRPPAPARPRRLSLTQIGTLIRDPYAIYARKVLGLAVLKPLRGAPDARLRGETIHRILERFVRERPADEGEAAARARLAALAARELAGAVPWPAARALWQARLDRAADVFLAVDAGAAETLAVEQKGLLTLPPLPVEITGQPDRVDLMADGRLRLVDYKTGDPPTARQQAAFEKQLLVAALMAERAGLGGLGPTEVGSIVYVGLKPDAKPVVTEITPALLAALEADLRRLLGAYLVEGRGFTSRRAMFETKSSGDYDHLARYGEWDLTTPPQACEVGR
jgi:double-strand break repair protein AddB